jgi:hypothetical protein
MRTSVRTARHTGVRAAMLAAGLWCGAGPLLAQDVRWTGSFAYATGSYVFDQPTHTLSLSNGLTVTFGPVELRGTLPLIAQNSHLVSQVGGIPLPTGGEDHGIVGRRSSGETVGTGRRGGMGSGQADTTTTQVTYRDEYTLAVGDPFLSASATIVEDRGILRSLRIQGSGKVPLRDLDSGVGTGAWDGGLGASALTGRGRFFVFADVMYWWFGDLPELEIDDGVTYGTGAMWAHSGGRASLSLSYFAGSRIIDTMDPPRSIGVGFGSIRSTGRSLSAGLLFGLSESAPDLSAYVGWSLDIG